MIRLPKIIYLKSLVIGTIISISCNTIQESASLGSYSIMVPQQQQKIVQKSPNPDEGKAVFLKYCMPCHQKDGSGVPSMFPPVRKSDWVNGDKKKIISVILNGLEGEINVNGEIYSQVMPKQDYLSNKQIAQVLSYLRLNLGNKSDSVTVKEVITIRKK